MFKRYLVCIGEEEAEKLKRSPMAMKRLTERLRLLEKIGKEMEEIRIKYDIPLEVFDGLIRRHYNTETGMECLLPVLKELNQNHGVKSEEVERIKNLILESIEKQLETYYPNTVN